MPTARTPSAFLVTLWTARKRPLFGRVVAGRVELSRAGKIVRTCVEQTPAHYAEIRIHAFVIMPDHLHLVLGVDAARRRRRSRELLGRALRSLKAIAARVLRANGLVDEGAVWQQGFHDAALVGRAALAAALRYVREHPLRWSAPPRPRELGAEAGTTPQMPTSSRRGDPRGRPHSQ